MKSLFLLAVAVSLISTCQFPTTREGSGPGGVFFREGLSEKFGSIWYDGMAEVSTYAVTQERYGELREAAEVLIFVTEDFSSAKQVKLDDPAAAGADRVPVLKMNTVRRFHTGIYDYSIEQSVFTPLDVENHKFTLKTVTTVQDWCGQTFTQLNLADRGYRLRWFSYFEKEGDTDTLLSFAVLEDELLNRLRLNPASIPTGTVAILPSSIFLRLRHQPAQVFHADLQVLLSGPDTPSVLTVRYLDLPRTLDIFFESTFPHRILGWEERDRNRLSSKGTLRTSRRTPYWKENSQQYRYLRDSLALPF